jgi:dipeptidyl aminopeptidase/acylaminoacyl peptidase
MTTHVIVLPGGGYQHHAPHEGEPVAQWLRSLGVEATVYKYPVETRHPDVVEAVRLEVARVRDTGATKIGLLGFSAGGHAAGHAALTTPGIDFAILGYPVVSMMLETHQGSRENLIGLEATEDLRAATSLERLVSESAPPFFVWHTAEDASVPVEHAYLLGQALAANGVPHALHVFERGRHGLGLAPDTAAAAWTGLCAQWLAENGFR